MRSCRSDALRLLPAALAVALTMLLGGCGSSPTRPSAHAATQANDVLFRAIGLVGTPYRYGGNTPAGGFDCSGLVGYVFREATGLSLPRNSRAIADISAPKVERKRLAPGDLVFFGKRTAGHIGIYVGEGRFVHAPSSGGTVRMDRLDGHYWKDHYLYAKRVLR
ncbi:C40 family peptidase [Xanthomonadaceae bacterium JHOS43]|nr:C40 family peptidase [Xanthomonadaceae bacterium JHOS43]